MPIPVIDLFAGPGGLGEGFSSVFRNNNGEFDIRLSIEKDENAHQTLELRSFIRQFPKDELPKEYYDLLHEPKLVNRAVLKKKLFENYPIQYLHAKNEAWLAELGSPSFPSDLIDKRITEQLNGAENWVLIGGPPCQAYSLVGRSRRQEREELNHDDHRVFLYKEYLRIIAIHHPAVFVMENVKGLLSAKLGKQKVFDHILSDLRNPAEAFPDVNSPTYKIFSLSMEPDGFDAEGQPIYKSNLDFLIKAEEFGVPQKRHRVILLGIRNDINVIPSILVKSLKEITVEDVIGDLPKLRSGISRSKDSSGNKRYLIEDNTTNNWTKTVKDYLSDVITWNGFKKDTSSLPKFNEFLETGSEFVKCTTPSLQNPLREWYKDDNMKGVTNHESRSHLKEDLLRYLFSSLYAKTYNRFPRLEDFKTHSDLLMPNHKNAESGKFNDRFRTQLRNSAATTVTSHISKDGHYFIHYDPEQCRSFTVREAARIQTFPDNYLFCGSRTAQFHQVGNAVPPYLAKQIAEIVRNIF